MGAGRPDSRGQSYRLLGRGLHEEERRESDPASLQPEQGPALKGKQGSEAEALKHYEDAKGGL